MPGYYNTEKTFAALLVRRRYETKLYVTDVAMMRERMFPVLPMLCVIIHVLHLEDLGSLKQLEFLSTRASAGFHYNPR